jgi:polyisoprenoid-binding protein YceI
MTTSVPATSFTDPAPADTLERAAAALRANNFAVEILDDAAAARTRVKDLVPEGASVFTGASETLRLSGIDEDINNSRRYADFFHTDEHPQAVLTVTSARPAGRDGLECHGDLDVAGHARPVTFTAHIQEVTGQAVVLTAELEVDRTEFGMTWSPLRMASMTAAGTVKARFTRA